MISRRQIIESQQELAVSNARLDSFVAKNGLNTRQLTDNHDIHRGRPSGGGQATGKLAAGNQPHQDHYRPAAEKFVQSAKLASTQRNQAAQGKTSRLDKLKSSYNRLQQEEFETRDQQPTARVHGQPLDANRYNLRKAPVSRSSKPSSKQRSYQVNSDADEREFCSQHESKYQERSLDSRYSSGQRADTSKFEGELMQQAYEPDYRQFDPYSVYGEEDEEEDVWYSEERLFEVSVE